MFTVWLAVTGVLIMVVALVSVDSFTGLSLNEADADPVDPASPVELATAAGNGDSVVYGSLEWTLVDTRLVPRGDDSFSTPVVILEMVARNLDGEHQARARRRDMTLILEDGTRASMDRFEHTPSTYRIAVEPGQAIPVTLVFKPVVTQDPWLDELSLEIAEQNRRPAVLPLHGSPAPSGYPLSTAITAEPRVVAVQAGRSEINVTLVAARVDINAGQYRARTDELLVVVKVAVDDGSAQWAAHNFWQLTATALDTPPTVVTPSNGGVTELVFAVPADTDLRDLTLSAGSQKVKIGSIRPELVAN